MNKEQISKKNRDWRVKAETKSQVEARQTREHRRLISEWPAPKRPVTTFLFQQA